MSMPSATTLVMAVAAAVLVLGAIAILVIRIVLPWWRWHSRHRSMSGALGMDGLDMDIDMYRRELARRNAVQNIWNAEEQEGFSTPAPVVGGRAPTAAPRNTRLRTSLCFHVGPGPDGRCPTWFTPEGAANQSCRSCVPGVCGMQGDEYVCKPVVPATRPPASAPAPTTPATYGPPPSSA